MCSQNLMQYLANGQPIQIDPDVEDLVPLAGAGELPPLARCGKPRTHIATLRRWSRDGRGPRKIKLETMKLGRDVYTSREAVVRFACRYAESMRDEEPTRLNALPDDNSTLPTKPTTGSTRPTVTIAGDRVTAASRQLDSAGLRRRPRRNDRLGRAA